MAWLLVWTTTVAGYPGPANVLTPIAGIASEPECQRLMKELRVRGKCIEYQIAK